MTSTADRLESLGVSRVFVADDTPENLDAARGLSALFPKVTFLFFSSGAQVTEEIRKGGERADLVLTDKVMEKEDSGLEVLDACVRLLIPVLVISGGHKHRDDPLTIVAPGFEKDQDVILGDKKDASTWVRVLEMYTEVAERSHSLWSAFRRARRAGSVSFADNDSFVQLFRSHAEHSFVGRNRH